MGDINWQNLYSRRSAINRQPLKGTKQGGSKKDSFADHFLNDATNGYSAYTHYPNPGQSSNTDSVQGDTRYQNPVLDNNIGGPQQAYQSYPPSQTDYGNGNNPYFDPQNMGAEQDSRSRWRFFNLKAKKQTGDLYKKILNINRKNNAKVFCFTSASPKEGVTTIIANLLDYVKQQRSAKQVLVIDANVSHPVLSSVFGLPSNCYGLRDVMARRVTLQSVLIPVESDIRVLCCGRESQYDKKNFEPEEFYRLLRDCRQFSDFIFIDCPPVLSSSDALAVAPAADVSFLILQAVKTRRQVAEKVLSALQNNECEMGGVILNRVQQVIPSWLYRFI